MATALEPRPLADLEMDSILAVEAAWARRSHGLRPQSIPEYLDAIAKVHALFETLRQWQRRHPKEAVS